MIGLKTIPCVALLACGLSGEQEANLTERLARPVRIGNDERRTVEELAKTVATQAGVPLVTDPSAQRARLDLRPSFAVGHVTAYEALAGLAYIAGLEVVVLPVGAVLLGPDSMPAGWQALAKKQRADARNRRESQGRDWRRRLDRTGRIHVVDVTLSAALRVLRETFGVDVLAPETLWQQQKLISLMGSNVKLRDVLEALARQLDAVALCRDGIAWLTPSTQGEAAAVRVRVEPMSQVPLTRRQVARTRLNRRVHVREELRTPVAFLAEVARRASVEIKTFMKDGPQLSPKVWNADGRLDDVLEAARLAWGERWLISEQVTGPKWTVVLSPVND